MYTISIIIPAGLYGRIDRMRSCRVCFVVDKASLFNDENGLDVAVVRHFRKLVVRM